MSFAEVLARKNASVFTRLGEVATWAPVGGDPIPGVWIIRREPDEVARFGQSGAVMATAKIRVRAVDVATPAKGDVCQTAVGDVFKIIAKPLADPRRLVWECEATLVATP